MTGKFTRNMAVLPVTPESASGVAALFYKQYGYSYSVDWLYDPSRFLELVQRGYSDAVLIGRAGGSVTSVLGFLDFRFSHNSKTVLEIGVLTVDPELDEIERAQTIALMRTEGVRRVTNHVIESGVRLVMSTETTDHTTAQRFILRNGLTPTGLLFATVPANQHILRPAQYNNPSRSLGSPGRRRQEHRRAEVLSVHPMSAHIAPYSVSLPEEFGELLRLIYGRLDLPASFGPPGAVAAETDLSWVHAVHRGIVSIDVKNLGQNAPQRLVETLDHFAAGHVPAIQFMLPLDQGALEPSLAALTARGCILGGLLPQYKGSDRLVLQRVSEIDPLLTEEHLIDEVPKRILRLARSARTVQ